VENSQPLPGPEPPIIQPVAQHYTTELLRFPKVKFFLCLLTEQHAMKTYWGGCGGLDMWHAWGRGEVSRVVVGRPEGKRPLGRPRRKWEENIKMDLREIGFDGAN
jgi:hypothetical protein